ncbi:hypothetical protein [Deinococcus radiophilus]|uniref:hypothetical protein n=1 Tax=Deinococcus radiophilus TaxID=32062 RepID=UPI0036107BF0
MTWTKRLSSQLNDPQDSMWDWLDEDDLEPQRGFPWWTLLLTGAAVAGAVWLARQRSDEIKELAVERLIEQPAAGQSFLKLEEACKVVAKPWSSA